MAIARQMDEAAWFRAAGVQYVTVAGGVEHDQQDVDVAERVDRQSFARLVPLLDALRTAGLPVPRMPATVTVRAREMGVELPGVGEHDHAPAVDTARSSGTPTERHPTDGADQ